MSPKKRYRAKYKTMTYSGCGMCALISSAQRKGFDDEVDFVHAILEEGFFGSFSKTKRRAKGWWDGTLANTCGKHEWPEPVCRACGRKGHVEGSSLCPIAPEPSPSIGRSIDHDSLPLSYLKRIGEAECWELGDNEEPEYLKKFKAPRFDIPKMVKVMRRMNFDIPMSWDTHDGATRRKGDCNHQFLNKEKRYESIKLWRPGNAKGKGPNRHFQWVGDGYAVGFTERMHEYRKTQRFKKEKRSRLYVGKNAGRRPIEKK